MSDPEPHTKKPPHVIGGFEILSKIGQGAMGAVFRARQISMDRVVAIKILPPRIARGSPAFIERFAREARASARLSHPNIVQGIEFGKDAATGLFFFAMEYVPGLNLRQLLREKGRLEEVHALKLALGISQGLAAAHQKGIIHRDIKPDNVLLTERGDPKLADLGLARLLTDPSANAAETQIPALDPELQGPAELTQTGIAVGTPHYMAPEQIMGQPDLVDARSDLYALGALLYHLLTGQVPFSGVNSKEILEQRLQEEPVPVQRLNPELSDPTSELIASLMQFQAEDRIQTAQETAERIEELLLQYKLQERAAPALGSAVDAFKPRLALNPTRPAGAGHPVKGLRPRLLVAAGAGLVLVGLLAFWIVSSGSGEEVQKSEPVPPPTKTVQEGLAKVGNPAPVAPGPAKEAGPGPGSGSGPGKGPGSGAESGSGLALPPADQRTPSPAPPAVAPASLPETQAQPGQVAGVKPAARPEEPPGTARGELSRPPEGAGVERPVERGPAQPWDLAVEQLDLAAAKAAVQAHVREKGLSQEVCGRLLDALEPLFLERMRVCEEAGMGLAASGKSEEALRLLERAGVPAEASDPVWQHILSDRLALLRKRLEKARKTERTALGLPEAEAQKRMEKTLGLVAADISASGYQSKIARLLLEQDLSDPKMARLEEKLALERMALAWPEELFALAREGAGALADGRVLDLQLQEGESIRLGKGCSHEFLAFKEDMLECRYSVPNRPGFTIRKIKLQALSPSAILGLCLAKTGQNSAEAATARLRWVYWSALTHQEAGLDKAEISQLREQLGRASRAGLPATWIQLVEGWIRRLKVKRGS